LALLQVGERLGWFIGVDLDFDFGSSCRTRNRPLGRRRRRKRKRFYKERQSEEEAMNGSNLVGKSVGGWEENRHGNCGNVFVS
jgi:hypothetical protein